MININQPPKNPGQFTSLPSLTGLRGIAVVAVLGYHLDLPYFYGGYTGVDIFFVLSGYLMTLVVDKAKNDGTFKVESFLLRRFYRIFPPLIMMMLILIPIAVISLDPIKLKDFSQSYVSIILLNANHFFWYKVDYFAFDSIYRPMLHTWSLMVEVQFYILIAFLSARIDLNKKVAKILLTLIFFSGIGIAFYMQQVSPETRFFLLPFRLFEFTAGILIYIHTRSTFFNKKRILFLIGQAPADFF